MGASDWLSPLNFPNSAESTSTLGVDRSDLREPPTLNHVGALQITRIKNWAISVSQYCAGMTRIRLKVKTLNPFGAGEYGWYIFDDAGGTYHFRAQTKIANVDTHVDIPSGAVTAKGDALFYDGSAGWVKFATGGAGNNGKALIADSTAASGWALAAGASVTSVTATAPLTSSGGATPDIAAGMAIPRWVKVNKVFGDLAAAGLTNDIEVYSLPVGGIIHAAKTKHSVAFGGGGIATYTLSVGIAGDLDKYSPAYDVFQAVSDTTFSVAAILGSENHGAATSIRLAAVSTAANLDQANAGTVDIWLWVSVAI